MTILTEQNHPGEAIFSCANKSLSLEQIIVLLASVVVSGEVVAKVSKAGASAAAAAGNTGDGAMGAITVGAGSKPGAYTLTFIEPGTNAGDFSVEDPDGINVGSGSVAAAFAGGGLGFTLADGAADFVAGDQFTITVADGSGKYVALDPAGTDGSETAVGVMYAAVDATAADKAGVIIARQAELDGTVLVWPAGITADEKTAATEQLAAQGLIIR